MCVWKTHCCSLKLVAWHLEEELSGLLYLLLCIACCMKICQRSSFNGFPFPNQAFTLASFWSIPLPCNYFVLNEGGDNMIQEVSYHILFAFDQRITTASWVFVMACNCNRWLEVQISLWQNETNWKYPRYLTVRLSFEPELLWLWTMPKPNWGWGGSELRSKHCLLSLFRFCFNCIGTAMFNPRMGATGLSRCCWIPISISLSQHG